MLSNLGLLTIITMQEIVKLLFHSHKTNSIHKFIIDVGY